MNSKPARVFPGFLAEWRKLNGEDFTPLNYVSRDEGITFLIAAQWLYVPDFVEYRGGVFRTELPRGIRERDRQILDEWYDELDGDIPKIEQIANLLTFWDFFVGCDTTPYDDDLPQVARMVARSWDALLHAEFKDRTFQVEVYDHDSYGPQVTFFSMPHKS